MIKYRMYAYNERKANLITTDINELEAALPKDRAVIVKVFEGRVLVQSYLVSWMGEYFKYDPCKSISDK